MIRRIGGSEDCNGDGVLDALLALDWKDGGNPAVIPLREPYRLVRSAEDRLIVCSASGIWE